MTDTDQPEATPDVEVTLLTNLARLHWPNYVTEGVPSLIPEKSTLRTRVKCDGDGCDFYFQDASWFVVRDAHAAHLADRLAQAQSPTDAREALAQVEALHAGTHQCVGGTWWTDDPSYRGAIASRGLCPTRVALPPPAPDAGQRDGQERAACGRLGHPSWAHDCSVTERVRGIYDAADREAAPTRGEGSE